MASHVVDTSVVMQRFTIEPYTPETRELLARMDRGDDLYSNRQGD